MPPTPRRFFYRASLIAGLSAVLSTSCVVQAVKNSYDKQGEEAKENGNAITSKTPLPANAVPPERFSYEAWDKVLKTYVNEKGKVDYQGLMKNRTDLDAFVAYVNAYSPENQPGLFPTMQDKEAYYINAYNASVFLNVLDKYNEVQKYKNIYKIVKPFFYETVFVYGGEKNNLYSLENKTIRPRFLDPRVHFSLNCASESCPYLPAEAFTGEQLDAQLDREAKKFCTETRNVRLEGTTLYLSEIFKFYGIDDKEHSDFMEYEKSHGGNPQSREDGIVKYINRFRPADQQLPAASALKLKYTPYNWTPNDQALNP